MQSVANWHGFFIVSCVLAAWNQHFEMGMGRIIGKFRIFCTIFYDVFLKSFVSCQALAEALEQNSTLVLLNLQSNNIGDEGTKAWCLVKMVS